MDQMFTQFASTSNGNRFSLDLEDGMRPLLTGQTFLDHYHDGKTVVIPDSFLPPGWSKHAYRNFGAWLTFLLTPDGFRIETYDELDNYYYVRFRKTRPKTLDFSLDEDLIPQLIYRQEHLMPVELFQYWEMQYIPTEKAMLISNSQDRNDDASCSHWPVSYPSSGICGVENVSKNTPPSWDIQDEVDPYTLTGNILESDSDELPSSDSEELFATQREPERPVLKTIDENQNPPNMDLNGKSTMPKSPKFARAASVRLKDSVVKNSPETMKEINKMYQFMGNTRNIPKEIYCPLSIDASRKGNQSYKSAYKAHTSSMASTTKTVHMAKTANMASTSNKPWLKLPPAYQESSYQNDQMNNNGVTKLSEFIEKVFICSCGQESCHSWEPTIQCAKCLTWQHIECMAVEGLAVDNDYMCFICAKNDQQDSDNSSPDEKSLNTSKEANFVYQPRKSINETIRDEHQSCLAEVNDVIQEAEEIRQKLSHLRQMVTMYEETAFPNELLGLSWSNAKNQKAWKRLSTLKQHYDLTYQPENLTSYPNYIKHNLLDYIEERKKEIVNEAMDLKYDLDGFEPYEGEDFTRLRECSQKIISRLKEHLEALKNACDL